MEEKTALAPTGMSSEHPPGKQRAEGWMRKTLPKAQTPLNIHGSDFSGFPGFFWRKLTLQGWTLRWIVFCVVLLLWWFPQEAGALELCSTEARTLMRKAGISAAKIGKVCALAEKAEAVLAISLVRREDALGYCRITLALHNNSLLYLNHLSLSSTEGRFEIFRFHNVTPGGKSYTSAKSRILLDCEELEEIGGITLIWPGNLRIGDAYPAGARLNRLKPRLLHKNLRWRS